MPLYVVAQIHITTLFSICFLIGFLSECISLPSSKYPLTVFSLHRLPHPRVVTKDHPALQSASSNLVLEEMVNSSYLFTWSLHCIQILSVFGFQHFNQVFHFPWSWLLDLEPLTKTLNLTLMMKVWKSRLSQTINCLWNGKPNGWVCRWWSNGKKWSIDSRRSTCHRHTYNTNLTNIVTRPKGHALLSSTWLGLMSWRLGATLVRTKILPCPDSKRGLVRTFDRLWLHSH